MSWKSVEMQVALPRTQDAGKIQEHLKQQGRLGQEQLAQSQVLEEIRKRQRVIKQQESEKLRLKNNQKEKGHHDNERSPFTEEEKEANQQHPYLGKRIDIKR
ncbi:hypothetical protein [Gracilibacillus dipsosauri]|uniref:RNA polymerase subunit sigma n=1 Tax=Gracilibacillus dipsosauri TaxID=178340 RepID=A0A317KZA4_9BACI|nr:hypothetical protein [Gracilibacillus dipsosauri]PWU68847.1 hypothetical protein DLJ74_10540 [Gracilibacillus dipsosauri]